MADIFLSYAREDRERASPIVRALEAQGWSVFWDSSILPGKNFRDEIRRELHKARCVVTLWSVRSIARPWVIDEAEEGRRRGILVSVLIDEVEPPLGFRQVQAATLTHWQGGASHAELAQLRQGVAALLSAAEVEGQATRPGDSGAQRDDKVAPEPADAVGTDSVPDERRHQARASWIFGSLLLLFVVGVFAFAPDELSVFRQRILAVSAALLSGFFAFFLTGSGRVSAETAALKAQATSGLGIFVLVLVWWVSPFAPVAPESGDATSPTESAPVPVTDEFPPEPVPVPSLYRVRVTTVGEDGVPVNDARVWSSLGGETLAVEGGWRIDVPVANVPNDGAMTVHAEKASAFLTAKAELTLADDFAPAVTVRLERDRSATIQGIVVDASTRETLEDVAVSVEGREPVITGSDGSFSLPAFAAAGEQVRLRAEKDGFQPDSRYRMAGGNSVTIVLRPRAEP